MSPKQVGKMTGEEFAIVCYGRRLAERALAGRIAYEVSKMFDGDSGDDGGYAEAEAQIDAEIDRSSRRFLEQLESAQDVSLIDADEVPE